MVMLRARVVVSLLLSLFFLTLIGFGLTYSWGAGFAPLIVGTGGLLLSLSQAFSDIRAGAADDAPTEQDRRAAQMLGWLAGLVALALILGILPGSFLFIAAYSRVMMRRNWAGAIAFAAIIVAAIYVFFETLLGLGLFDGWLAAYFVSNVL